MTPADITGKKALAIYQGAKWSHTLTVLQSGTTTPENLSGLTFTLDFKSHPRKALLFSGVAALLTDGTDGKITVLATAAQTDALALGEVWVGLRDQYNNAYLVGVLPVKYFPPDPA